MSVTIVAGGRATVLLSTLTIGLAAILLLAGVWDAFAQTSPFGGPRVSTPPAQPAGGMTGWIMAKQAEFYRALSGTVRAAKTDGTAVWGLLALSFLYGVFHASGPGHGKAVISSYLVANNETWKRGMVLSFASALLQALVAVAVVGVAAVLLRASAATMNTTVRWIEIVSYALIAVIGVRLLCVKGLGLVGALRKREPVAVEITAVGFIEALLYSAIIEFVAYGIIVTLDPKTVAAVAAHQFVGAFCFWMLWVRGHALYAALLVRKRPVGEVGAAVTHPDRDQHAHHEHHDHGHAHDHGHHHHGHDHGDASAWGHAHAPEPRQLAGPGGWQRGLTAIVAVGLRPCSGAILVLVFALAQGLFWAGVVATFVMALGTAITVAVIATLAVSAKTWAKRWARARPGTGTVLLRGVEVAAAAVILAFGLLLLTGYMANERLIGV